MVVLTVRQLQTLTRGRRIDLGISQEALAAKAGVSRKWVSAFERGKASAELPFVLRLLAALDLQLHVVQSGSGEPTANQSVAFTGQPNEESVDLAAVLKRHLEP